MDFPFFSQLSEVDELLGCVKGARHLDDPAEMQHPNTETGNEMNNPKSAVLSYAWDTDGRKPGSAADVVQTPMMNGYLNVATSPIDRLRGLQSLVEQRDSSLRDDWLNTAKIIIPDQTSMQFELINRLKGLDGQRELHLPQLVVCGSQSSGKSSVLEALSGVPFPRHGSTSTRFVTELRFRLGNMETIDIETVTDTARSADYQSCLENSTLKSRKLTELGNIIKEAEKGWYILRSPNVRETGIETVTAENDEDVCQTFGAPKLKPNYVCKYYRDINPFWSDSDPLADLRIVGLDFGITGPGFGIFSPKSDKKYFDEYRSEFRTSGYNITDIYSKVPTNRSRNTLLAQDSGIASWSGDMKKIRGRIKLPVYSDVFCSGEEPDDCLNSLPGAGFPATHRRTNDHKNELWQSYSRCLFQEKSGRQVTCDDRDVARGIRYCEEYHCNHPWSRPAKISPDDDDNDDHFGFCRARHWERPQFGSNDKVDHHACFAEDLRAYEDILGFTQVKPCRRSWVEASTIALWRSAIQRTCTQNTGVQIAVSPDLLSVTNLCARSDTWGTAQLLCK